MSQNVNWMDNRVMNGGSTPPPRPPVTGNGIRRPGPDMSPPVPAQDDMMHMPSMGSGGMGMSTGGSGAGTGGGMSIGMSGTGSGAGTAGSTLPQPSVMTQQGPPPVTERYYVPGYLSTLIGKRIRAEFLIGNNQMVDRSGVLREVGVNYFVLEEEITGASVMCDLYSVKFVTFVR